MPEDDDELPILDKLLLPHGSEAEIYMRRGDGGVTAWSNHSISKGPTIIEALSNLAHGLPGRKQARLPATADPVDHRMRDAKAELGRRMRARQAAAGGR